MMRQSDFTGLVPANDNHAESVQLEFPEYLSTCPYSGREIWRGWVPGGFVLGSRQYVEEKLGIRAS